jgi:hypothetical protein
MAAITGAGGRTGGQMTQWPRPKSDVRRDRLITIGILIALAAVLAFVVWLASLGGQPVDHEYWMTL